MAGGILFFPVTACSATRKTTIRWAIELWATASATFSPRSPTNRCCSRFHRALCAHAVSRARNSAPPRRFNTSPITRIGDLGNNVSEGRRNEFAAFGWDPQQVPDPQDVATFERSKLCWKEVDSEPHAALLAWYRGSLLSGARNHPYGRTARSGRSNLRRAHTAGSSCGAAR